MIRYVRVPKVPAKENLKATRSQWWQADHICRLCHKSCGKEKSWSQLFKKPRRENVIRDFLLLLFWAVAYKQVCRFSTKPEYVLCLMHLRSHHEDSTILPSPGVSVYTTVDLMVNRRQLGTWHTEKRDREGNQPARTCHLPSVPPSVLLPALIPEDPCKPAIPVSRGPYTTCDHITALLLWK